MCIICIDLDRDRLSPWEAKRNLKEMSQKITPEHAREVENKISEAIYNEIYFNFGDTLHDFEKNCEKCSKSECVCTWDQEIW